MPLPWYHVKLFKVSMVLKFIKSLIYKKLMLKFCRHLVHGIVTEKRQGPCLPIPSYATSSRGKNFIR